MIVKLSGPSYNIITHTVNNKKNVHVLSLYCDCSMERCTFIVALKCFNNVLNDVYYCWNVGVVNKPKGQDFIVRFSQKNSDLNKVDIPEG